MKIPKTAWIMVTVVFGLIGVLGCRGNSSNSGSSNIVKESGGQDNGPQNSITVNFERYPADYGIAYFNMLGWYPAPAVRDLFGPNAAFVTSFQGVPAVVNLEKASGTNKEFTGQLLLTINTPEQGEMKVMRLLVTFEPDTMSEMSYARYIKLVSLVDGNTTERRSYGDQNSDGEILGIFAGAMEYFWDVSKLQQ
ncbi:MAG: hypothetical protein LBK02_02060 [Treponema sp.]|jgi:hypothetical protein|nr:hypothetical protein [Treponema sp.]